MSGVGEVFEKSKSVLLKFFGLCPSMSGVAQPRRETATRFRGYAAAYVGQKNGGEAAKISLTFR